MGELGRDWLRGVGVTVPVAGGGGNNQAWPLRVERGASGLQGSQRCKKWACLCPDFAYPGGAGFLSACTAVLFVRLRQVLAVTADLRNYEFKALEDALNHAVRPPAPSAHAWTHHLLSAMPVNPG